MVLASFSVLGDSVFTPLESRELKQVEETLNRERIGLYDYKAGLKVVLATQWLYKIMKSGSRFEHKAFVVFWLYKYDTGQVGSPFKHTRKRRRRTNKSDLKISKD